ncbi:MAG: hypothetical protein GTO29_04205 [Candidatus Latescibacteria bacterium]|nr:hypothetical protein [Candidatus Latescibacterota bacterium]NIO55280.1 hypothetical protein [Candidatus Latescibacterota bacterium]
MKIRSFEFNLRELAGSMGDFGTLVPLAIGYFMVCGMNPAGLLVMMGLANIATGLAYRLPMPIEPMKVLAVVAIAQHWSQTMVYAAAFAMGFIWLIFALTGVMVWVARLTPNSVVYGIQVSLGVMLAIKAFAMLSSWWILGVVSVLLVLLLRNNRYAPAAVVLMILGIAITIAKGGLHIISGPGITLPPLTRFSLEEIWETLVLGGFAQIPLTATNAVIATAALIKTYWPDRQVSERKLSLSHGLMNLISPFFGGMSMCHGAGGLAGQYFFGARTGGTNIIEGIMEISLGFFLASSIAGIMMAFPMAILGAMMLLVGIELVKFARKVRFDRDFLPFAATVGLAITMNMAFGFLAGLAVHYATRAIFKMRD